MSVGGPGPFRASRPPHISLPLGSSILPLSRTLTQAGLKALATKASAPRARKDGGRKGDREGKREGGPACVPNTQGAFSFHPHWSPRKDIQKFAFH